VSFICNHHDYLCIPILNTLALTVEQLEQAVSWIMTHLAHEGIFVHCALGYGRSIIIIAGFLLKSGLEQYQQDLELK
jgi:protein-tyrosine phosphatase